jgi:hypothetical protein
MPTLIQGFFFLERLVPDIGYDSTGARALIRNEMLRTMFSGIFGPEHEGSETSAGRMTDHYGESTLRGILYEGGVLNFVKLYDRRTDHINYQFKKCADGTWRGNFAGKATGTGQAHCVLTTVPENFLLPEVARPEKRRRSGSRR